MAAEAAQRAGDGTAGVYLTFDIDVVDPAFCPAQKYPEPAGLTAREAVAAVRAIGTAVPLLGFDLCCLAPRYDTRVGTGRQLAARLFAEALGTLAWRRRREGRTAR